MQKPTATSKPDQKAPMNPVEAKDSKAEHVEEGKAQPVRVPNVAPKINPKEQARLQAQIGNLEKQNADFFSGESKQKKTLEQKEKIELKQTPTVYFKNCSDSEYVISKRTSKILIDGCKNCTFVVDGQVLTSILEIWKCENIKITVNTPLKTLQLDLLHTLDLIFQEHSHLGCVVWNSVEKVSLSFLTAPEHNLVTGVKEMTALFPDTNAIIDQFIIRWLEGKPLSERCIRLKNGFLSTEREADDWDKRNSLAKETYVQKFIKDAGINLNKEKGKSRTLPNAPCHCGSGKKFKKCCFNKKQLTGVNPEDAARVNAAATDKKEAKAASTSTPTSTATAATATTTPAGEGHAHLPAVIHSTPAPAAAAAPTDAPKKKKAHRAKK